MDNGASSFYLFKEQHWEIKNIKDLSKFFANIMLLFPNDSYLCLKGGMYSPEIKDFIDTYLMCNPNLSPARALSECSIIPINTETMTKMVYFANNYADSEIADDIYVYKGESCFLQWFDIIDDPIYVAAVIPERSITIFCRALGTNYELETGD